MEQWSFTKYTNPYLAVEAIRWDAQTQTITLVSEDNEFELSGVEDAPEIEEVLEQLTGLTTAGSSSWNLLRGNIAEDGWYPLVQVLDNLGLLKEEIALSSLKADPAFKCLWDAIAQAALEIEAIGISITPYLQLLLTESEQLVQQYINETKPWLHPQPIILQVPALMNPLADEYNFFILTIRLQLRNWKINCPTALMALAIVIQTVLQRQNKEHKSDESDWLRNALTDCIAEGYDMEVVEEYIRFSVDLLQRSMADNTQRCCKGRNSIEKVRTGLEFILLAEELSAKALSDFGQPRFLRSDLEQELKDMLIKASYAQEYHITVRFVEIITPMLSKRLSPPIRKRLFQYYAEEIGHEKFEMQTCHALGIDLKCSPLSHPRPLHRAFIDIFTYIATIDPLSYMASIFLTEGLSRAQASVQTGLPDYLIQDKKFIALSTQHEQLNEKLNHPSLSRLLLADVAHIAPAHQRQALDYLLFLTELNVRAWEDLYEYCTALYKQHTLTT